MAAVNCVGTCIEKSMFEYLKKKFVNRKKQHEKRHKNVVGR